ncbi:MAG: hypothetical protein H6R15_194 [Proteobacteria bacterium]|nr:hypothetical protein [Pseudomonadota bacterium]
MPIKIHHGPPGSYKTAGALGDDFLREAKAGRVIVTNVRGLSRERVIEHFPDLPSSFDVIHVDDKTDDGRVRWSTWFHWVPHGAFLFVDEVQDIWPKRWRESDLRALDYPGGVDQATKDDRPYNWDQAFDKHRHYNWDMVLTTPNYAKVRDDVKGAAEMAYKHKNLAIIGWGGRYIEAAHMADDSGKASGDFLNIQRKRVPKYVFDLYDSTQTGAVSDSSTGFNLFSNPRVMLLLLVLIVALFIVFRNGRPTVFGGNSGTSNSPGGSSSFAAGSSGAGSSGAVSGGGVSGSSVVDGPFTGDGVFIVASVKVGGIWKYSVSFANTEFTNDQILDLGYIVQSAGSCGVRLIKGGWQRLVTCGRSAEFKQVDSTTVAPGVVSAVPPLIPSVGG